MADDLNKKIAIDVEINTDGQQQINQYKVAFDSLRSSVSSLSTPLAGLSNNVSSLDKDITKLTDSIGNLANQNKTFSTSGNKAKETVNDLATTFTSWKTIISIVQDGIIGLEDALTGGLAVLTVFGPEILKWIGNMLTGNTTLTALNKTLKDNKIVMDAVNQARAQGLDDAQQELVHLKLLYKGSQDQNLSLNERKKIVSALQSQYPAYFGNMSTDAILAGKAAKSYNELTKAIIATARAKAAEDIMVKNQVRQFGNNDKLQKLKTDLAQYSKQLKAAQKEYDDYTSHPAIGGGTYSGGDSEEAALYQKLAGIKDKANEAKKAISDLNTDSHLLDSQNDALAKTVITDTEAMGAKVLGVAKNTNDQLLSISTASLSKQHSLYKEAEKENSPDQNNQSQPIEAGGSTQRGDQIDPGQTPAATFDNSITQQPTGGFNATIAQQDADKDAKIKKTAIQQVEDYAKQSAGKIASDAFSILNTSIKQQSEAKIAALQKDETAELSNKSLTSAQRLAIEQKYKQQEAAVKTKAFKEEQEASIASAVINGALAITKAEAQTGMLGTLVIPGIIAETAVQVAKIAAQKPPAYAKGGLHYSSDGRGGVLPGYSKTDNTNAYLRSGEGVVVSEAMQVPWARNLVSAINVGFGGRDFAITNPGRGYAVGGIFTDGGDANRYYNQPVTDQKNLANTIAYQMINNFPPVYVDVKDVNNQQNILAQTINRVNL